MNAYTDLSLVFWNALFYNEPGSQIALDADTLKVSHQSLRGPPRMTKSPSTFPSLLLLPAPFFRLPLTNPDLTISVSVLVERAGD
jgi:hypothetical protein